MGRKTASKFQIQIAAVNGAGKILPANRKEPDLTFVKSSSMGDLKFRQKFPSFTDALTYAKIRPPKGEKYRLVNHTS